MTKFYMCDFCWLIGTKEEIEEHEKNCICNPAKRSCRTCKHYDFFGKCLCAKRIEGKVTLWDVIKDCNEWEHKEN